MMRSAKPSHPGAPRHSSTPAASGWVNAGPPSPCRHLESPMPMNNRISLIGAPTDIGAGSRGASMGPEALRVAHIAAVLAAQGPGRAGPGQPGRPQQPLAAAGGRLPPPGRGHPLEPGRARRGVCRTAGWPPAHSAGWRPLPGHWLDQRRGAALPGCGQKAARAVAGCPCRLQHQPTHAQRQHPRHAGSLPVRPRPPGPD